MAVLVLDLCDKSKGYLVDGPHSSKTLLVLDEIINNFKHLAESSENLRVKINNNISLISRI